MIWITDTIGIRENEVELRFVRSGGPGGQHVNKVATGVQLRFDAVTSPSLPSDVQRRLKRLAGARMNADGVLTIEASRFRSQKRNRDDALERLVELLREAAAKPKRRRKTAPSAAARKARLEEKKKRSDIKRSRAPVMRDD